jgi:hypothetical protein
MNERDFPHLVELELPPGGLPSQNLEFDAFHREHGIPIRRGRGRHEAEQFHVPELGARQDRAAARTVGASALRQCRLVLGRKELIALAMNTETRAY